MSKKHQDHTTAREVTDTGFTTATTPTHIRQINEDGTFNVKVVGRPLFRAYDIYHGLISMSWLKFNLLVFAVYLTVNLFFASIYYAMGLKQLAGIAPGTNMHEFMEAFFFSAQTLTTVGYGRISPVGLIDSSVAAIESLFGLLGFALATGLLYGRFSKPVAKIVRSKTALIAPYKGAGRGFMFRIANKRRNNLIGAEIVLNSAVTETINGTGARKFYSLELEIKRIELFPLSWTIVHPINEKSPFYGYTESEFRAGDPEFIISFKAYDESFSQNVLTRFSYKEQEIVWGAKFIKNFEPHPDGYTLHHLDKISDYESAQLPEVAITADTQI